MEAVGLTLKVVFRGYGISIVAGVGIFVSLLSIIVLLHKDMKRSSPLHLLLLGLQISDLILNILHFAITGLGTLLEGWMKFLTQNPITITTLSLLYWGAKISSHYFIVYTSVFRYIAVCQPLAARRICTKKRSALAALSVLAFSVASTLLRWHHFAQPDRGFGRVGWLIYELIILYVIPFTVIMFTSMGMFIQIRTSHNTRTELVSSPSAIDNYHINNLLLAIVFTFMLCNSLNFTYRVLEIFDVNPYSFEDLIVLPFSDFFLAINSLTNAIYYCLFAHLFRTILRKFFRPTSNPSQEHIPLTDMDDDVGIDREWVSELETLVTTEPIPQGGMETLI